MSQHPSDTTSATADGNPVRDYYLALDLSTSNVGISLFSATGELADLRHLELKISTKVPECERLSVKADVFAQYLETYTARVRTEFSGRIAEVFVEEPLLNGPSISTVVMLASFNAMCCHTIRRQTGSYPTLISVHQARKTFFPELAAKGKLSFPPGIDKKMFVWEKVSTRYPHVKWIMTKKDPSKPDKKSFDMSDAVVVGYSSLKIKGIYG